MSLLLSTANIDEAINYVKQEAQVCWQGVLETAFGVAKMPPETDAPDSAHECLWFSTDFVPSQFGSIAFGLNRDVAIALGHLLLTAKGRASEHDHHALHASGHLIGQFATSLAHRLADRFRIEITAADCSPAMQMPDSAEHFTVPITPGQSRGSSLIVAASPAMLSAVAGLLSPEHTAVVPNSRAIPRNLDLLLDVEMPVSVSFGGARLALKDVANLTTGSIVELNRALSEPVEIVVNNCAIARGEVVVVDGNFGVRINQVISRQDRLRSLSCQ